jgi:DNA-binding PadR family transcriptional regulator
MTRWLRLLRAQGLIRKVPHTRYYRLTQRGEEVLTTAQRLRTLHLNALAA